MAVATDDVAHLAEQLGRLLIRSNRVGLYDEITAGIDGITTTTYPVLSGVARTGPVTVTVLAQTIGMDRTVVTKYVLALVDSGLLTKTAVDADRRASTVDLTAAGRRVVAVMRRRLTDILRDATGTWDVADVVQLADLIDRLVIGLASRERRDSNESR